MDWWAGKARRFSGLLWGLWGSLVCVSAWSATITVDTLVDDDSGGGCSLRAALLSAQFGSSPEGSSCVSGSGRDSIIFSVSGVIALNEPLPEIPDDVDIVGPGPEELVIDAGGAGPVFAVAGTGVSISGLGLTGGAALFGGGLLILEGAAATVANVDVVSNAASRGGGGVAVHGRLDMRDSLIRDNSVFVDAEGSGGGGVYVAASGLLSLQDSVLANNETDGRGGGLFLAAVPEPPVLEGLEISGNAALAGGGGVFAEGVVFIEDSSVTGNSAGGGAAFAAIGGGIQAGAGIFAADVIIAGNRALAGSLAGAGGLLSTAGDVSVSGGQVAENKVEGAATGEVAGAILGGMVTLMEAGLADNAVEGGPGRVGSAMFAREGVMIARSTVRDNNVSGGSAVPAAAVYIAGATSSRIVNSTFDSNRAGTGGSILLAAADGALKVTNATITGNHGNGAFAGIRAEGMVELVNTIVFSNDVDCATGPGGTIASRGFNIDGDGSCRLVSTGDRSRTDPMLGPLADNGGPTPTHALLPGSPAIDRGSNQECPENDQRGFPRPEDGNLDGAMVCDIGAVEQLIEDLRVVQLSAESSEFRVGDSFRVTVSVANDGRSDIEDVAVRIDLPNELSFVSASRDCTAVGVVVSCKLGTLPANSGADVVATLRTEGGGRVSVFAAVSGNLVEHRTDNNTAELVLTLANNGAPPGNGFGPGNGPPNAPGAAPVVAVPSRLDGVGGGSMAPGWITLLALMLLMMKIGRKAIPSSRR
jgi:uncharacterized repeat protein (TIGR01451 family)